jgi:hypothetical protein
MSSQAINSFGDFPACVKDFMNFEFCEVNVVKLANAYVKNQESVNFSKQEFEWRYDGEVPNEFKTERIKKIEEANTRTAKIRAKFGINSMNVDFGVNIPHFLSDGNGILGCPKNEDEWKAFYNHVLKICYEEIKDFYEKQKEREKWLETQKQELIDKRKQQEEYSKKFDDIMNSLPKTCDAKQHRELCKDLDKKVPFKKGFKTSTWTKNANNSISIVFNKE